MKYRILKYKIRSEGKVAFAVGIPTADEPWQEWCVLFVPADGSQPKGYRTNRLYLASEFYRKHS